jgi:hypothetical protein
LQKRARINAMRHVLNSLDYPNKNPRVTTVPNPLIVAKTYTRRASTIWKVARFKKITRSNHASIRSQAMSERFRDLVEQSGDSMPSNHYDELRLIIEAGLDTARAGSMEKIAGKLKGVIKDIQQNAEFFD